jgi:hypothetical protein
VTICHDFGTPQQVLAWFNFFCQPILSCNMLFETYVEPYFSLAMANVKQFVKKIGRVFVDEL